jgi:hypothetical protein
MTYLDLTPSWRQPPVSMIKKYPAMRCRSAGRSIRTAANTRTLFFHRAGPFTRHSRPIRSVSSCPRTRTPMKYFFSFCTLSTLLYQPANHHHDDERSYYVTMDDHVIEWRIGILILYLVVLVLGPKRDGRFCLCLSIRQAFCLRFSCLHGLLVCNCTCLFFLHCIVDSDNPFLSFVRHRPY